jgi:heme oxygenase (biliverdin-producing, ferredoxin)
MSPIDASPVQLSQALRQRTASLHVEAERSGIINDILRGRVGRLGYLLLLRNLLPAYRAMERGIDARRDSPIFRPFAQVSLRRSERISADMVALGTEREEQFPLLMAAEAYAATVMDADGGAGLRLIAHAYVRYFGDLSGGLVIKRLIGKSLGVGSEALSFYDVSAGDDPDRLKGDMRAAMDYAITNEAERETILDEAVTAFQHNIALSRAVQEYMLSAAHAS